MWGESVIPPTLCFPDTKACHDTTWILDPLRCTTTLENIPAGIQIHGIHRLQKLTVLGHHSQHTYCVISQTQTDFPCARLCSLRGSNDTQGVVDLEQDVLSSPQSPLTETVPTPTVELNCVCDRPKLVQAPTREIESPHETIMQLYRRVFTKLIVSITHADGVEHVDLSCLCEVVIVLAVAIPRCIPPSSLASNGLHLRRRCCNSLNNEV